MNVNTMNLRKWGRTSFLMKNIFSICVKNLNEVNSNSLVELLIYTLYCTRIRVKLKVPLLLFLCKIRADLYNLLNELVNLAFFRSSQSWIWPKC